MKLFGFAARLPAESYLLRVGPNCHEWLDPYTHTAVAAIIDGVAWLQGMTTASPTRGSVATASRIMKGLGFDRLEWDRLNHDQLRHIVAHNR